MHPIYLDYNATTPIDNEVADYMIPFLKGRYGNPSSTHHFGTEARLEINRARKQVASLIGCSSNELIFTSGGTESNNLAIRGIAYAKKKNGNHIITSSIEHPAVLEVCRSLEKEGFRITYLTVTKDGRIDLQKLRNAITPATILVSIMHANNETGVIQPVQQISEITQSKNIIFHSDAAQSAGKIPVKVEDMGVDLLSLAAHKFYGPKGTGALYIKNGVNPEKILFGANHERNLRPGTENLLEIAGMGKAAEIAERDYLKNVGNMAETRDRIFDLLKTEFPACSRNGDPDQCLPNTLSISFPGLDSNALISGMPEIALSAGAACHADEVNVSYVLEAMGISADHALGTLRISTGKGTSLEESGRAAREIIKKIKELLNQNGEKENEISGEEIKLTRFTHGLGCACKISPRLLEDILSSVKLSKDPNVLVGTDTSDDAAVYRINESTAIVQTVDFFTPIVDDPREFGAITAANALSDIYAMGAKPLFALNIVAFPPHRLPLSVLKAILEGAEEVAREAGISILGGHTIEDNEPKYGMTVTGIVHPDKILKNKGARENDAIILTKKLGTGILSTAVKRGLCSESDKRMLFESMRRLNNKTSEIILDYNVTSCTDVSGFGLLGHLKEICEASAVSAEIIYQDMLFLPGAEELAADGIIPGGTENNLNYLREVIEACPEFPLYKLLLAADAQTSGGLLFTVHEKDTAQILNKLHKENIDAAKIGKIIFKDSKSIYLVRQ